MNRILKVIHRKPKHRGFTLVMVLSLLMLLVMIAVGVLSLSATSLRQSAQASAMSQARANAKMALMLALGELQLRTGLDTRVTAPADLLDASNPPLVGVWRSWEGSDHDVSSFAGRPRCRITTPNAGPSPATDDFCPGWCRAAQGRRG